MDIFESDDLMSGETRRKGITITKNSGTLDITSATYVIYDEKYTIVTSQTDATISGPDVFAYVEAGSDLGGRSMVIEFHDGEAICKAKLNYAITR